MKIMNNLFKFGVLFMLPLSSCGGTPSTSKSEVTTESTTTTSTETTSVTTQKPNYDEEIEVNFDVNSKTLPIDENTYGQFIEHIDTCIYNGIWSEMIMDRKFYSAIQEDVSQWKKGGDKDIVNDQEYTYSGGYAPIIKAGNSIYQRGIGLIEKSYDGYFYANGNGTIKVSYKNDTDEAFSQEFTINSDSYVKQTYSFSSSKKGNYAVYFETIEGCVQIDSLSLMPSDNYHGMRCDSLEKLKELNAPFYRWPGGNFVSGYTWTDGIGDRDQRHSARNLHYAKPESNFKTHDEMIVSDIMKIGKNGFYAIIEPNDFGMDEFIAFCRYLNAEPNIVVNAGLGTAEEAANEVAYCNTVNTEWGNKRPSKEPYNVKYFSIGNEMNGNWQLGYCGIDKYKVRHCEFYDAMKAVDSNIEIIMVGDNYSNWTKDMLDYVGDKLNYVSEHFYAQRDETNAYNHIKNMKDGLELRIQKHRNLGDKGKLYHLSFDEYAYDKVESASRLKDGMGVAAGLNSMIYNNDILDIACYSSTVNAVQGSIVTDLNNVYMEGNGYILKLYRNHFESNALKITNSKPVAEGYFELAAAISNDKKILTISVINATDKAIKLNNALIKGSITDYCVSAPFLDSYNSEDFIEITESETTSNEAIAKKRSVSIFKISLN